MSEVSQGEQTPRVQVPLSTAQNVTCVRDHLGNAAISLDAAAELVKPYSADSSAVAIHLKEQVRALEVRVQGLLDGLEVVS